jgi:hypothetical protein
MGSLRQIISRPFAAGILCAAVPGLAGGTATLVNRSGSVQYLIVKAPGSPVQVSIEGGASPSAAHHLPPRSGSRSPLDEAKAAELFSPCTQAHAPAKTWLPLPDGATATITCAKPVRSLEAELVLLRLGPEGELLPSGLLTLFLSCPPGLSPEASPEPEARLALAGDPVRTGSPAACNRNHKQVSPGEVWLLSGPERKAPAAPTPATEAFPELPDLLL